MDNKCLYCKCRDKELYYVHDGSLLSCLECVEKYGLDTLGCATAVQLNTDVW